MVVLIIGYGYCMLTRLFADLQCSIISFLYVFPLSIVPTTVDVYGREMLLNL